MQNAIQACKLRHREGSRAHAACRGHGGEAFRNLSSSHFVTAYAGSQPPVPSLGEGVKKETRFQGSRNQVDLPKGVEKEWMGQKIQGVEEGTRPPVAAREFRRECLPVW